MHSWPRTDGLGHETVRVTVRVTVLERLLLGLGDAKTYEGSWSWHHRPGCDERTLPYAHEMVHGMVPYFWRETERQIAMRPEDWRHSCPRETSLQRYNAKERRFWLWGSGLPPAR